MTDFLSLDQSQVDDLVDAGLLPAPVYPLRLPSWTSQPLDPAAPLAGAAAISQEAKLKLYARLTHRDPDSLSQQDLADMEQEFEANKQVAAIAEADGIRTAGELEVGAARILQVLVGQAMVSGLHAYHPDKYASVETLLHDKLDDLQELHPGGSTAGDLTWLIGTFVPLCAMQGVNGYEMLWQEGTVAKTRMIADFMRTPLAEAGITAQTLAESETRPVVVPPQLAERVTQMVKDAVNKEMPKREFAEKHGANQHPDAASHPKLDGYHFNMKQGGATLVFWTAAAEQQAIELAVNASFKMGTSSELDRLKLALPTTRTRAPDVVPVRTNGHRSPPPPPPARGPRPAPKPAPKSVGTRQVAHAKAKGKAGRGKS